MRRTRCHSRAAALVPLQRRQRRPRPWLKPSVAAHRPRGVPHGASGIRRGLGRDGTRRRLHATESSTIDQSSAPLPRSRLARRFRTSGSASETAWSTASSALVLPPLNRSTVRAAGSPWALPGRPSPSTALGRRPRPGVRRMRAHPILDSPVPSLERRILHRALRRSPSGSPNAPPGGAVDVAISGSTQVIALKLLIECLDTQKYVDTPICPKQTRAAWRPRPTPRGPTTAVRTGRPRSVWRPGPAPLSRWST
jgi:hypothetical protein